MKKMYLSLCLFLSLSPAGAFKRPTLAARGEVGLRHHDSVATGRGFPGCARPYPLFHHASISCYTIPEAPCPHRACPQPRPPHKAGVYPSRTPRHLHSRWLLMSLTLRTLSPLWMLQHDPHNEAILTFPKLSSLTKMYSEQHFRSV